jgi:hypothetical protein
MLLLLLVEDRTPRRIEHGAGPIELGRGPGRGGIARVLVEDPHVSRDQMRVEGLDGGRVRIENLSRTCPIRLADGTTIAPGETRVLALPVRLSIGQVSLEILDPSTAAECASMVEGPEASGFALAAPPAEEGDFEGDAQDSDARGGAGRTFQDLDLQLEAAGDFDLDDGDSGSGVFAIDEEDVDQSAASAVRPAMPDEDELVLDEDVAFDADEDEEAAPAPRAAKGARRRRRASASWRDRLAWLRGLVGGGRRSRSEARGKPGPRGLPVRMPSAGHGPSRGEGEADPVDCTIFAPPSVARGASCFVQAFAHLPDQGDDARRLAREFDDEAERRAVKSLGLEIERGSRLLFHLAMPGLEVDDAVQELTWRGRPESVQFGVTAPAGRPAGPVIGTVTISQDRVPLGHIKFKLAVVEPGRRGRPAATPEPRGDAATRYSMAFISYASEDRTEVLKRVQMLAPMRIRYFQDVLDLEPGARWERELFRHIDESDLFLLFWSSSARRSEWVLREVRYALGRKGGEDLAPPEIRPVILEGPPVPDPPEELAHYHFNDHLIYFMR